MLFSLFNGTATEVRAGRNFEGEVTSQERNADIPFNWWDEVVLMATNLGYRELEHDDTSEEDEDNESDDGAMAEEGVNGGEVNMGYFSQFSESWNEAGDFNRTKMSMLQTLRELED